MKVIKPLKIGMLHRSFEYRRRCFWSPAVLAFFSFDGPPRLLTEIDMWTFSAAELGREGILDQGMPKERGELLVTGAFHAPGGRPVPAGRVSVRLGPLDKTLYVFGRRYWKRGKGLIWGITEPEPVTRMPITWQNAFGGHAYPLNPLGKGLADAEEETDTTGTPLPHVEDPAGLIGSRRDRPKPAGFGALDMTWPQRAAKGGTYDQQWFDTLFPGLADDIDWTFFNTAPEDQQIDGHFSGDEAFAIEGMHPQQPRIQGRLPALRPRCFISRNGSREHSFTEVALNLDTVWLFPHALKGILIYHGLVEVQSDTAKEIDHLLLAYEFQKDAPRDLIHYHDTLNRRLDKETGAFSMLDESDLIAENERSGFAEMMASETITGMKGDGLLRKKQQKRMEMDIAAVRAMIAQQGLDPDQMMPMPVQTEQDWDHLDFDRILSEARIQRRQAEVQLEAQLAAMGSTPAEMVRKAATEPAPRPVFAAAEAVAAYRELGIRDPDLEAKMARMESAFHQNYRKAGHALPPVLLPPAPEQAEKKKALLEAYASGLPSPVRDLAGIDLSGLDLEGIDLRGVLLEDAKLNGTCLRNANLEEAALMRADLSGADLTGANLAGAGMGKVNLHHARLSDARLCGAHLVGADLRAATLRGADFEDADLSTAVGDQADLTGARLTGVQFLEADFSSACFADADLSKAMFYKTRLREADFTKAVLAQAVLVETVAEGSVFRQADLTNLRAAFQCSLENIDFTGATLCACNFRGAALTGAGFAGADLSGADFSEARLTGCDFSRAKARATLFIEADLTDADFRAADLFESLLHRATLFGTRFIGANLYGVDFMKARFRNTDVTLALLEKSTLHRWAPR